MKISDLTKSGELRNRPSLGMKIDRADFGSWNQTGSLDETVMAVLITSNCFYTTCESLPCLFVMVVNIG